MTNYFERDYKKYGKKAQRAYPNTELISFIKANIKNIGSKVNKIKVLEVGCGTGANLWMLSQEKLDTYGIDNSKTAIGICKKNLHKKKLTAKLYFGTMTKLPFKNDYFDLIVDVVSMQNMSFENHKVSWRSIYNCLKPGGQFFSFHLGQGSTSFRELRKNKNNLIDKCTLRNVPEKYPLSHKSEVCFLHTKDTSKELESIGFKEIKFEKNTRTYDSESYLIEYLILTSKK